VTGGERRPATPPGPERTPPEPEQAPPGPERARRIPTWPAALAGWGPALRVARREARRAKGRSALVVALIGLPVCGAAFAVASYDMFTLTPPERLERQLGAADAQLTWVVDAPVIQADVSGQGVTVVDAGRGADAPPAHTAEDVLALLPPGSRVTPRWQGAVRLATVTGTGDLSWHALDLADPITRGIAYPVDGRVPAAADEVAVTATAAARLGAAVGDRLPLPDGGGAYTVVGVLEFPGQPGGALHLTTPGLADDVVVFHPDGRPGRSPDPSSDGGASWLADTPRPVDWEQVRALNRHGILVYSRAVAQDPPPGLSGAASGSTVAGVPTFRVGLLIGGLGALEIVLLVGPAFAVSVRRRQRDLALLAAGGGGPAQLRRIVLADGVVLGALAAGAGIALGVGTALATRPLVEELLVHARAGGYRVFPLALVAIAACAVLTGLLAALVPAVTAARQSVVDALAGRRGATRSRRRWLVLGAAMAGLGAAVAGLGAWRVSADVVLAGLVLGQLGLVLCTPALVGLVARIGPRLPLAPRIALRDTARNRAAAAPAISAVMAAVAGSVAAGVVLVAIDSPAWSGGLHIEHAPGTVVVGVWSDPAVRVDPAEVERVVRDLVPVDEVYRQDTAVCPSRVDPAGGSGEQVGESAECLELVTEVPPEKVCPYWEAGVRGELSRAEQRAARDDPRCDGGGGPPVGYAVAVDDGTALPALVGGDPARLAEAARVLRDGGAVVTDERYLAEDGTVTIGVEQPDRPAVADEGRVTVPGYLLADGPPRQGAIVPPEVVRRAGLAVQPSNLLFTTARMPTQAEQDALTAALEGLGTWGWVVRGPTGQHADAMLLLLAVAAGVVALGAAGIATGLAAADRRPDLATLGAVGASPRVRRSLSLSQSGVIAGLGTTLGVLAGLGGAVAVLVGLNQRYADVWPAPEPYPVTVPWPTLGVLLVVPVVAMLGAGLLTRSRLPVERRLT
jgi:putative ABC transport system permease protein